MTLVAAAASLVRNGPATAPTKLLLAGTICLVVAVIIATAPGWTANRSLLSEPAGLREMTTSGWNDDPEEVRRALVVHQLDQLEDLDDVCGTLDRLTLWATAFQTLALVGIAVSGGLMLA